MHDNKKDTPPQSSTAAMRPKADTGAQFSARMIKRAGIRNILSQPAK